VKPNKDSSDSVENVKADYVTSIAEFADEGTLLELKRTVSLLTDADIDSIKKSGQLHRDRIDVLSKQARVTIPNVKVHIAGLALHFGKIPAAFKKNIDSHEVAPGVFLTKIKRNNESMRDDIVEWDE